MGELIRVFLVDRHVLCREGLRRLLDAERDFRVVGETDSGAEAVERVEGSHPNLVVMDMDTPRLEGWEVVRRIKEALPNVKVVMLATLEAEEDLLEAMKCAVDGYLLKNTSASHLFRRLRDAIQGHVVVSRALAARLVQQSTALRRQDELVGHGQEALSAREKEVLRLVASGHSNKQIAVRLGIGESTVKRHLHNTLSKLGLDNRVQAATYAISEGLAKPASSPD